MKFKHVEFTIKQLLFLISREEFPATTLYSGKSFVRTVPAPIIVPFLTSLPGVKIT